MGCYTCYRGRIYLPVTQLVESKNDGGSVCLSPSLFLLQVFCHTFICHYATLIVSCRLGQMRKE